uniref:Uncharacterized protein n=1 Tax=Ixodes ricinus TaxID=34613 RepID=A0A6B0U4U8_IXORI
MALPALHLFNNTGAWMSASLARVSSALSAHAQSRQYKRSHDAVKKIAMLLIAAVLSVNYTCKTYWQHALNYYAL